MQIQALVMLNGEYLCKTVHVTTSGSEISNRNVVRKVRLQITVVIEHKLYPRKSFETLSS